jgi:signal transduction histidine kinase
MYNRERDAVRQAERASADREELQRIVVHDLRNPLHAIAMRAEVLKQTHAGERVVEQCQAIERLTAHMGHLIGSLRDAASIEAGHFSVSPTPLPAAAVIQEALDMCEVQARAKQLRLRTRVEPPDCRLFADRERLMQALSNLIENGIRFTPRGGEITVAVDARKEEPCITVADTGPGVPAEHLPYIFDRYYTAGDGKGTGLGLYITKSIVEAHGGRIWVCNGAGGACATFCFSPARSRVNGSPRAIPRSEPPRRAVC